MTICTTLARTLAAAVVATFGHTVQVQAATLTFDDLGGGLASATATYGIEFRHSNGNGSHQVLDGPTFLPSYVSGSFLGYYALTDMFETLALPTTNLSVFSLAGLDLIGAYNFFPNESGQVTLTGYKSNGSTVVSTTLTVTGGQVASYGGAMFSSFTGLTSLRLSGVDGARPVYIGVDNININITPVPEPESVAMLLAGLGVVGVAARRRKRV